MKNTTGKQPEPAGLAALAVGGGLIPLEVALSIRELQPGDREAVLRIEAEAFGANRWRRRDFSGMAKRPGVKMIVAEVLHRVAGYAVYCRALKAVEVCNVALDPRFRRLGLGRLLVAEALAAAAAHRRLAHRITQAFVREGNLPALAFFTALGFVAVQVIRDYYRPGTTYDDAIRMVFRAEWGQETTDT